MIDPRTLGLDTLEQQNGLPKGLLAAVAQTESNWNPNALGPVTRTGDRAQGLFQFMPKTARAYGVNAFDPQSSAVGAARMYGDLLKQHGGDLNKALAGWNWGSGNMQRQGMENMPQETRDYIQRVTSRMGNGNTVTEIVPLNNTSDMIPAPEGFNLESPPAAPDGFNLEAPPAPPAGFDLEAPPQQVAPEVSRGRTALEQGLQGATFGFGDEIMNRLGAGIASVATGEKYGDLLNEATGATKERMAQQMEQRPALSIGSNLAVALATGGVGATTKAGSALTRLAGRGLLPNAGKLGNLAGKAAVLSGIGATQGALYGAGASEEGKRLEGAGQGAVTGAVVGGAIPVAGAAVGKVANAVVPKLEESMKPLVKSAEKYGIPLRLDQVAPSRVRGTLQKVSQEIPLSGVEGFEAKQSAAWNKALAKTLGIEADNLAPEVVDKFLAQSSNKFRQALGNRSVKVGKIGINRIDKIAAEAGNTISDDLAEVVRKNASFLKENIGSGVMDAKKIASVRSQMIKRVQNAQGGAKQYLSDLVDIIDTAAARNMPKAQADILKQARREWRNYKIIQPLLEGSVDGMINPTQLMNRVKASKYVRASSAKTGDDALVDLARIGKLMTKKGGSDTFQKSALTLGLGTTGAGLVVNPVGTLTAAGIAGAGAVANRLFQTYNAAQPIIRAAANKGGESALMKLGQRMGMTTTRTNLIKGE